MIFEYLMTIIKASVTKVSHGGFFEAFLYYLFSYQSDRVSAEVCDKSQHKYHENNKRQYVRNISLYP